MNLNFRSSLHGFNRQDVANYLEYLNNRHAAQVNQLNTDLEALRRQAEAPAEDPQRTALEARCRELEQRGQPVDYQQLLEEITQRDYADSHRAAAPLRQAEDAWLCDSTHLDFEGTVQAILAYIRQRIGEVPCR